MQFEGLGDWIAQTQKNVYDQLKVMKGITLTKVSRKNSKNSHPRLFFYCPNLDALCWRDPKQKFPNPDQTIPITQITSVEPHQQNTPQGFGALVRLAQGNEKLELFSESQETRDLFVGALRLLVQREGPLLLEAD